MTTSEPPAWYDNPSYVNIPDVVLASRCRLPARYFRGAMNPLIYMITLHITDWYDNPVYGNIPVVVLESRCWLSLWYHASTRYACCMIQEMGMTLNSLIAARSCTLYCHHSFIQFQLSFLFFTFAKLRWVHVNITFFHHCLWAGDLFM